MLNVMTVKWLEQKPNNYVLTGDINLPAICWEPDYK